MKQIICTVVIAIGFSGLWVAAGIASLTGDVVQLDIEYGPNTDNPFVLADTATVADGAEFEFEVFSDEGFEGTWTLDLDADTITVIGGVDSDFACLLSFSIRLGDLDWGVPGVIIDVLPVSQEHPLTITFGPDEVILEEPEDFTTPVPFTNVYQLQVDHSGAVQPIAIDIKPGSSPNAINCNSKGVIPVAILGAADFDVSEVDVESVQFGSASVETAAVEDVNADDFEDLVLHFRTQETGIACGDTEATLTGALTDGTLIEGTDAIKTVGD